MTATNITASQPHVVALLKAEQQPFASTTGCAIPRLFKCRVRVRTATGEQHSYTAMFKSTCGAVMDALDRFGLAKVSVEAIKK